MAVTNSIANRTKGIPDKSVEYKAGDETVKLSPIIIRSFLVNGGGKVTDQEVTMFLNLCRFQHLNPFLREAYLIKYGNQPATMVIGKDAITKRAFKNPRFAGMEAGVVVLCNETGELEYRPGALVLDGETLVGGWSKIYVKGYNVPIEAVASFPEYAGRKKNADGSWSLNSQWSTKPATMIRKVALVQAMREAFPEDLSGMYSSEEMHVDLDETEMLPIDPDEIPPESAEQEEKKEENPDEMQETTLDGVF